MPANPRAIVAAFLLVFLETLPSCVALPSSLPLRDAGRGAAQIPGITGLVRRNLHDDPKKHIFPPHSTERAPTQALRIRGGSDAAMAAGAAFFGGSGTDAVKSLAANDKVFTTQRKVGLGLVAVGILLSMLGFMLFMNRSLIGSGNLMIISGVVVLAGWSRTKEFLFQWERARGTGIFLFGVYLVLKGWARLGVLVELFGILNLFANFMPALVSLRWWALCWRLCSTLLSSTKSCPSSP
eukprot:CAMPEP_0181329572 /NCGR_PEP_ID=MMETSP1101-20121128/23380_1 /TAXON_ID=46948 /ORGANISM="Rhodomonas abbreviata, Strain Caron Lab Isolate" /LENGTH=238 /DNA_ID=CAMNT_0023438655 /DNA_START=276 /DNA_END=989 /DNA_ORIENTATION=+